MKVIDSSGWIEHFAGGPLAEAFWPHLADVDDIITPSLVLYEVYRWARRFGNDAQAMDVVGHLEMTRIAPVDTMVAVVATDLSLDHELATADAIIYATARLQGCELVTADADFRGLKGVTLIEPG